MLSGIKMTLIMARIVENNIYIESDSRITDPKVVRQDPLCGLLKSLIIHPFVCLSFAGIVFFAEKAIDTFFKGKNWDIDSLLAMLLSVHQESGNQTDFILASIMMRRPVLYKISEGVIEGSVNAWIGDYKGFRFFQETFGSLADDISMQSRMQTAFKTVIENPARWHKDSKTTPSIGDFHISIYLDYEICPSHPVFLYCMKTEIVVVEPQLIKFKRKGELHPIPFGTTKGGAYGISYLRTVNPSYHGVGIHFFHGNFGVIFCPQLGFQAQVIAKVNSKEFVSVIKERYNIQLNGFIMNSPTSLQYV